MPVQVFPDRSTILTGSDKRSHRFHGEVNFFVGEPSNLINFLEISSSSGSFMFTRRGLLWCTFTRACSSNVLFGSQPSLITFAQILSAVVDICSIQHEPNKKESVSPFSARHRSLFLHHQVSQCHHQEHFFIT